MKKRFALAGVMILAAVLLVLPVGAKAEMYVEAYLGGVQAANMSGDFTVREHPTNGLAPISDFSIHTSGKVDPHVIGGIKVGTWFVKEGFLGYNYPDWMKYLGFYVDFSYHNLAIKSQSINGVDFVAGTGTPYFGPGSFSKGTFSSEDGFAATLAFMFAARYGFLPDSEVPFGRLQPYVAVGPAVLFTSMNPKIRLNSFNADGTLAVAGDLNQSAGTQNTATICLAVDAGLRWMCLKNVSLDASFKYRFAQPSFDFEGFNSPVDNRITSFTLNPTYHLFSGQLGAAYHF